MLSPYRLRDIFLFLLFFPAMIESTYTVYIYVYTYQSMEDNTTRFEIRRNTQVETSQRRSVRSSSFYLRNKNYDDISFDRNGVR